MMEDLVEVRVGEVFPLDEKLKKIKGGEGGQLDYNNDNKTLCMYVTLDKPRASEKQAFRKDLLRFRLYRNPLLDTAVVMVMFGTELQFDLLYDINILDADMDGLVEGNRFDMFLIDSKTGIVHAMRTIGLGKNFMSELNRICKNDGRYTTREYNEWVANDVQSKSLDTLWKESEPIEWDK